MYFEEAFDIRGTYRRKRLRVPCMYIRPLAVTGELRKVPTVHILPNLALQVPPGWAATTDAANIDLN